MDSLVHLKIANLDAIEPDSARIRFQFTAEQVHNRSLSGAVGPDQGMNMSTLDPKAQLPAGLDRTE